MIAWLKGFPLPSSLFPLLLFVLVLSCTSLTTRPNIRPFPLASFDSLVGVPSNIVAAAKESVSKLGMKVAAYSAPEGYLETRWFDTQTRASHRFNTNPGRFVRLRVWADLITPRETQIVVETVYRQTIDPSVPDREVERIAEADSPGDSLTHSVLEGVRGSFPKSKPDSAGKSPPS